MDNMPWYDIFLESLPEAFILVCVGLSLIGFQIKQNFKQVLLVALLFSLLSFFVRSLPITYGYHIIIHTFILIFLTMLILKLKLKSATLTILIGSIILMIFESLNVIIFSKITGFSINQITTEPFLRTFVPYIHFSLLGLLVIIIKKKNITMLPLMYRLNSKKIRFNFTLILVILILSSLTITLYTRLFLISVRSNIFSNVDGIRFLNTLMFVLLIITAFTIKKVIVVNETQAVLETQEMYLNNLNNLHSELKSQRHDFVNHVQVINGLLKLDKYTEATEYSDELCHNILAVNKVAQVKNPVIAALIQSKIGLAETNEVKFTVNLNTDFEHISMTSLDLAGILANLLDNAFDATSTLPVQNRSVTLWAEYDSKSYNIKVSNTGLPIPKKMLKAIFNSGVSGKKNHTGLGLSIIKRMVDKYKGTIDVKSDEQKTMFTIIIPGK